MIIDELDLVGIAIPELKDDSPRPIGINRQIACSAAFELVQSDAAQGRERAQRRGGIQFHQPLPGEGLIQSPKPYFPSFDELPGRGAFDGADHTLTILY